jgi:protein-tyrosine kinase
MNHQSHPMPTLPLKGGGESIMGHMLLALGKLKQEDTERVLHLQREYGIRFGEAAIRLGLISENDVQQVLAHQFGYHYLSQEPEQGKYPPGLVAAYQPFSEQVETMRTVRAQLMRRWFSKGRKSLAVAAINRGDGASFFVANLAVVFAQLGEHTLLIDANLRTPRQHEIFNLTGRQGLSDILANRAGIETFSKVEFFENLSVLPAGTIPPNPQELVSRSSFSELRKSLASRFDIILIDMPALAVGADAMTIAGGVGGILLVCRNGNTGMADLNAASAQLDDVAAEVVGSVLNVF